MSTAPKPATPFTRDVNTEALSHYAMEDVRDFQDAAAGFIAGPPNGKTLNEQGEVVFDDAELAFFAPGTPTPETVNASLWRQSQVLSGPGLYRVVDRLYQFRGPNMANLTIVEGDDGLIVIDTTSAVETAKQGMDLFRVHVADKPVVAVIYTHTHVDHYGGVRGVVDEADVRSGAVPIIAPGTIESFDKHALGENVIAGNAMSRRASYAFGGMLPHSDRGMVSIGVGLSTVHHETVSYLSPTDPITRTGETRTIAGLTFEFLYAPDTEAPEEMHIWIPELKALTCAENANHLLHNIQTLRGARTRDARNFARYLDETIVRWGRDVEVHYGMHTWPVFGNAEVVAFLESQRDTYKYLHDQSLRLANQGLTPVEAAEILDLPDVLGRRWFNRGYHGTVNHDIKAVFAKELGWWDGDPAHLYPLPPVESAKRWVEFAGAEALIAEARRAGEHGDYRWAVEVLHHVIFADPDNVEAKEVAADAYEQLGYQSEGPQWRGIFLTAAMELRGGIDPSRAIQSASKDTLMAMPMGILFDYLAVHIIGPKAADVQIRFDVDVTDIGEHWTCWIANGVLNARPEHGVDTPLTLVGAKAAVTQFLLQPAAADKLVSAGALKAVGDMGALKDLPGVLDTFDVAFPIVTP